MCQPSNATPSITKTDAFATELIRLGEITRVRGASGIDATLAFKGLRRVAVIHPVPTMGRGGELRLGVRELRVGRG